MRQFWIGFFVCFCFVGAAFAAPNFPILSGRVVDGAQLLALPAQHSLAQLLADHEAASGNQVVVATVSSLEGISIEEYGVQLARQWQIGQKEKNNGVLLLVAPQERGVRIEVGYGLEGVLTDALSRQIIEQIILPEFRVGHMQKGIVDGAEAVVSVLGGVAVPALFAATPMSNEEKAIILFCILAFVALCIRYPVVAWWFLDGAVRFGGRGGNDFGGGGRFSGGGGSFGGGGASGRW